MVDRNGETPRAGLAQARRLWLHYKSLADDGRTADPAIIAADLECLVGLLEREADRADSDLSVR